jgi:serine-type D-Ala-D-Ala carboxypeptidase (penicillin-binding protein 5/6)
MRLTARLVIVVAVAAIAAGVLAAWASTRAPAPAFEHKASSASSGQHKAAHPAVSSDPSASYTIKAAGAPGGIKGKGAELVDADTGQVLWGKNMDTPRPMASVTKVMTALVVIEAGDLNRQIKVPKAVLNYVAKYGAESGGLVPGNVLTTGELLEALLVTSAADAAYALANAYGPGLPAFIAQMNEEASELGMDQTRFTSPDGLPYPSGTSTYSTPSDLITLGLAAMRSPVFRSIVDQPFYQLKKGQGHRAYWWNNTNGLIGHYNGALGIKTGWTPAAGHCLLFAAERNGRDLLGVVLGSPQSGPDTAAQDAERMLNWGFALPSR